MKFKDSQIVKGGGIIMLFIFSLYSNTNNFTLYNLTGSINPQLFSNIANSFYICTMLFVFVTAYGITVKEKAATSSTISARSIHRVGKLIAKITLIFLLIIFTGAFLYKDYKPSAIWGSSLSSNIIGVIFNVLGIAPIFKVPLFAESWLYISYAILFIFLVPVLYKCIKRFGGFSVFVLSLFIPYIFSLSTADFNIFRFLPTLILGIVFAEYNLFDTLKAILSKNTIIKIITIIVLIISIPLLIA